MSAMPRVFMAALLVPVLGLAQMPSPSAPETAPPATSLAEPPYWPLAYRLPETLVEHKPSQGAPAADLKAWIPEGAKRIRAVLLIPENSDSKHVGEHAPLRAVAAKHEVAILYVRTYDTGVEGANGPGDPDRMPKLLDYMAEQTGIKEFRYAPWITFGKSSRGKFPFRMAWSFPERTIASVTYHGETPTWPVPEWARLRGESILQVSVNGETEWGGTWYNHVRPSLLNYRARENWLAHQVVVKDVGHGDYVDGHGSPGWGKAFAGKVTCIQVWDYLALFIDKSLGVRVPKDAYPTDGPLALKPVDEATGYLIDPFAVEELFGVPPLPLHAGADGYVPGDAAEPPVSGYSAVAPAKAFAPPEGVPVVKLEAGRSPGEWLLTDGLKFAMQADPMLELGELRNVRPRPGDKVTIDDATATFGPPRPAQVAPSGGIAIDAGFCPPSTKITFLAYTVLDVAERKPMRVNAVYTAATRVQMVLNGVLVRHRQVVELEPGRYPMLVAVRMGVKWDKVEPRLEDVSEADVALAREMQAKADAFAAEQARLKAAGTPPKVLVRRAADVPKEERSRMFWVADREQAEAWFALHAVHGQSLASRMESGGAH